MYSVGAVKTEALAAFDLLRSKWRSGRVRASHASSRGFEARCGTGLSRLLFALQCRDCVSLMARMITYIGCRLTDFEWDGLEPLRNHKPPGSDHPQCPYRSISGTAVEITVYTFLRYPWSSDQHKQPAKPKCHFPSYTPKSVSSTYSGPLLIAARHERPFCDTLSHESDQIPLFSENISDSARLQLISSQVTVHHIKAVSAAVHLACDKTMCPAHRT